MSYFRIRILYILLQVNMLEYGKSYSTYVTSLNPIIQVYVDTWIIRILILFDEISRSLILVLNDYNGISLSILGNSNLTFSHC